MTARSVVRAAVDRNAVRPTWLERDGAKFVTVNGHSVLDCFAALAVSAVVIGAAMAVLAVMQ